MDDSPAAEGGDYLAPLAADPVPGRIRVLSGPGTGSIGAAKALAAGACRGTVLVELDHDDELRPQALELILSALLARPNADFLYSDWVDVDRDDGAGLTYPPGWAFGFGAYASEVLDGVRLPVALAPPLTWETVRHIVSAPNHVRAWRAEFYRRIGGHDSALPIADDYELFVRTFLTGTAVRVPRPLYVQHHDRHGAGASRRRNAEIQRHLERVAAVNRRALEQRCLELELLPSPPSPLTGWQPLPSGNLLCDPLAEADARRGEPLVSVVTPTYRRPRVLARAIDSVLSQSYENLELLVVGHRCDAVDELIATIDDPRVRHWNLAAHARDSGTAPRNYALKAMARGTLIAYLDDDNAWDERHLESLVALLTDKPEPSFAFSSLRMGDEEIVCRRPRQMQIDTSALLHRRSLLERFGYWRSGPVHDWELVSRWRGERWAATLLPTMHYALRPTPQGRALLDAVRAVAEQERAAADEERAGAEQERATAEEQAAAATRRARRAGRRR